MSRILVTGASRGLGRALTVELSRRGHHVIATARSVDPLADLDVARTAALDVADEAAVTALAAEIGVVDVVVNNAGNTVAGPIETTPLQEIDALFDTNVFGPLRVTRAFLPAMRASGSGTIVNISSLAGRFAPPLQGAYAGSKAALEMFTEALAFETRHFGVRVVAVSLGAIRTDMLAGQRWHRSPDYDPLVDQVRSRQAEYQGGMKPERAANRIADLLTKDRLPARVRITSRGEAIPSALRNGHALGRLSKIGLNWSATTRHRGTTP